MIRWICAERPIEFFPPDMDLASGKTEQSLTLNAADLAGSNNAKPLLCVSTQRVPTTNLATPKKAQRWCCLGAAYAAVRSGSNLL